MDSSVVGSIVVVVVVVVGISVVVVVVEVAVIPVVDSLQSHMAASQDDLPSMELPGQTSGFLHQTSISKLALHGPTGFNRQPFAPNGRPTFLLKTNCCIDATSKILEIAKNFIMSFSSSLTVAADQDVKVK